MSDAEPPPVVPVDEIFALWIGNIGLYAGAALLIFDYFLTLPAEVRHIWRARQRWTLVILLFVTLRYSTLSMQLLSTFFEFVPILKTTSCNGIYYAYQVLDILGSSALSAIFVLRTYAIYNRSMAALLYLSAVATGKIIVSIALSFGFLHARAAPLAVVRTFEVCVVSGTQRPAAWLLTANLVLVILFDTSVLLLTVARTRRVMGVRALREEDGAGWLGGYGFFVLRDGLLYYFAIELLVITTVILNQFDSQTTLVTILQGLEPPLSSILVQRFVLSLRQLRVAHEYSDPGVPLQFAHGTIIGNIGAPLASSWGSRSRMVRRASAPEEDLFEYELDEWDDSTLPEYYYGTDDERRLRASDMSGLRSLDTDTDAKDTNAGSDRDVESPISRLSFVRPLPR